MAKSDDHAKASEGAAVKADASQLVERWARIAARSCMAFEMYAERQRKSGGFQIPDVDSVARAFAAWTAKALDNPKPFFAAQASFVRDWAALYEATLRRLSGDNSTPAGRSETGDRRFSDPAWRDEPAFAYLKDAYLLYARQVRELVASVDGLDRHTRHQVCFYTDQILNALAPSNFAFGNPKVLKATIERGGENLLDGVENMLADMERGGGRLDIAMTKFDAFRLGDNIAATPGKVVYQNEMMQLIQYSPSTDQVRRRPLLIVPPWINKYYILDLSPKNSLIGWLVAQGQTVFLISWINPGPDLAHKGFEDYMLAGPLAALDAIELACREREVNIVGYCIGGTLTAATLAWMAAKGDKRVQSATFLTTMIDFAEAGDLAVFIDEAQLQKLQLHLESTGYLEGHHMAAVFNLMRSNDLIWAFFVNNYLLGREPMPFDLLYWNSDSTRMPASMHEFYLRQMYLENRLVLPGGVTLAGEPIDLRRVAVPTYLLSTRDDHIAPWRATYSATQIYGGPIQFVLAGSGHIAGVINPPTSRKYGFWTRRDISADPDNWLSAAIPHEGSWWPHWAEWLSEFGGGSVPARYPGDGGLRPIEDAPGAYVRVRAVD
ncbi:MAG TPA: class I poly(R)-hydroxyalkanoic acid synthase [Pseudolabrys sp.]|nr:class I poly(R)-hydroxyalkanoic acid synthase [Pseudolabrys sp.]